MSKRLSPKERLFVEHRAKGLTGVQAIEAAGFRGKRPDVAAAKLGARAHVAEALEAKLQQIAKNCGVTQERWFQEVWDVASTKIARKHISPSDKNKALEMAGRALGAFKDTAGEREMIGPGLTIVIQQGAPPPQAANAVPLAPGITLMPGPTR